MAKQMTLNEIMNLKPRDVKATFKDRSKLGAMVSTMRSVARKRYEREVAVDTSSNATWELKKYTKKARDGRTTKADLFPNIAKMSLKELQGEYYKYKKFLEDDTSTSKGLNKFFADVRANLGISDIKLSQSQMKTFLDIWNLVKDEPEIMQDMANYNECVTEIARQVRDGVSFDEILQYVRDKYNLKYAQQEARYNEQTNPSKLIKAGKSKRYG